jgi:hypothetical protein
VTDLLRYPRTPHLAGSRLQPGDEDLDQIPLDRLAGAWVVVEEKLDGSNAGISFGPLGELRLQSRGHVLAGGPRERQFDRFKAWAATHREALWHALGTRHVCFGEWLWATHTIFYDDLPAYFVEFDVWDREQRVFLDTPSRRALLEDLPVVSAPVLWSGTVEQPAGLPRLVGPSRYVTAAAPERFAAVANAAGLREDATRWRADLSGLAEGLYVKTEADGVVTGRYKWIRAGFHDAVAAAGDHWSDLPLVRNRCGGVP